MPRSVAFDQGLQYLLLIQQYLDTIPCKKLEISIFRIYTLRSYGVQIFRVNAAHTW